MSGSHSTCPRQPGILLVYALKVKSAEVYSFELVDISFADPIMLPFKAPT